jgi:hypothetical protein
VAGSDVGKTSSGLPTYGEVPNDPIVGGFEGMGEDFVDENTQLPSATPPAQPAVAAKSPAPAAVPSAAAPVTAPAPAAPVVEAPKEPVTAELPASTEAQPVTAEAILAAITKNSPAFIEALAPTFAVSDELALELEADYAKAVPKLLANVYMQSTATAVDYIQKLVPAMIERHLHQSNIARATEEEFFGKFKSLNRKAHGADIVTLGKAFTSANPKITREQLFDLVGAAVMVKHGIVPGAAAPSTVQAPTGFVPASNSAPVVVSSTPVDNLFEGLGREYES